MIKIQERKFEKAFLYNCKASKDNFVVALIFWFLFLICSENWFLSFLMEQFPKFWGLHRRYLQNHDSKILILFVLLRCSRNNISKNFRRLAEFYLKNICSKALNISMMNRDWLILFLEFFIRRQFVIMNKPHTSFMKMHDFIVILIALKNLNQQIVIKLYVKSGIH